MHHPSCATIGPYRPVYPLAERCRIDTLSQTQHVKHAYSIRTSLTCTSDCPRWMWLAMKSLNFSIPRASRRPKIQTGDINDIVTQTATLVWLSHSNPVLYSINSVSPVFDVRVHNVFHRPHTHSQLHTLLFSTLMSAPGTESNERALIAQIDSLELQVASLKRDRADLIVAFRKQSALVDLLKKQLAHVQAGTLLQLSSDEFKRAVEATKSE